MTCSTNALKAGIVSTLVYSPALGYGALEASGVGAENDFCTSVDLEVGKEPTWAKLSVEAHVGNWNNDARVLYPVRKRFCSLVDTW